uniref:Carboxylic ester hydrolase n=1 Tax=Anoplophora glabripennis TaxID=217634 RepID=A0A8F8N1D8_ANOGL|nr:carboxylesterase [Anoplophora glabripennis]QYA72000.1 carboxylesterase [Anoplophora glabripennis]
MAIYIKCILFLFLHILVLQNEAKENDLVVTIKNGKVMGGKNTTVDNKKTYYSFRGIPYAEPPLGDLRFSPPVPRKNWTGILNATVDRSICVQKKIEGSEDCLFISVYTTNLRGSKPIPVMVWVYGGFFQQGSSRYTDYGPDYFLDQDVVVVSFNYRVGVFGFLSTQDGAASGNWGLKDQILALHWVQDNVGYFGGDPERVTIFGESAGSASVSYLLQTQLTKGLFRGAIMESGTSLDLWALSRKPRTTAFQLGLLLGILTTNSSVLVKELRGYDFRSLYLASTVVEIGDLVLTNPRNGLIFAPAEEPDLKNSVVVKKSHEKLKKGQFNRVPMIVGFNSQEGLPFADALERVRLYLLTYDINPVRLIPVDMNVKSADKLTVATKIKTHYFGIRPVSLSDKNLVQYVTDDQFARPINEAVRLMSNYAKVYYYRFSYIGRLGLAVGDSARTSQGVGHGEELHYLWRGSSNLQNPPKADLLIRQRLIKLWTNFAKTLNPTPTEDPVLQNVTWTPATPQTQYYLDIGQNLTIETNLSMYSIDWWRELYNEYGNPPYDTY